MTEPLSLAKEPESAPQTVQFFGETFTRNSDMSEWAVLEFAEAADSGEDSASMRGMASLLRFVVEWIAEGDRERFRAVARRNRASSEDLTRLLTGEVEVEAERPTGPSADSSDGRESTGQRSDPNSDGRVSRFAGRPDLALVIEAARAQAG